MSNPSQPPEPSPGTQPGDPQQPNRPGPATLSLACGVLGILFSFCCLYLSLPLSVAAIIAGIQAHSPQTRGLARAGIACGILGLLLTIAALVLGIVLQWDELAR